MKFGVMFANTGPFVEPDPAVALAQVAEAAGLESIWTVEHVVVPQGYASQYPYSKDGKMPGGREDFDIPDPLIWLSYIAAATTTIKLATGILIVPQRNPVVTAKAVATLDRLSEGRVILGIGSGWLEEEFSALGVPFERRGDRTDEYLQAYRSLWADELPSYQGDFVDFDNAYCRPRPVDNHVPVIVGGHSKRAAERSSRDPDALEFTAGGPTTPEYVEQLATIGVTRMIVPPLPPEQFEAFGADVVAQFADA
jgi:probable F420-dependent oxidoreductase